MRPLIDVTSRGPGLKAFAALALSMAKGAHIRAGVVDDGKGDEATDEREGGDYNNAEIAAAHEYGNDVVPQRAFILPTLLAKRAEWGQFFGARVKDVLTGKLSVVQAFNQTGALMAADIKARVVAGDPSWDALSDVTQARKQAKGEGLVKTLIDTARMLGAISWRLVGLD